MTFRTILFASMVALSASPGVASAGEPVAEGAPQASERASYCLRVEADVGTRLESVVCRTRSEWADWGIDVDEEWAKEGVRVIDA